MKSEKNSWILACVLESIENFKSPAILEKNYIYMTDQLIEPPSLKVLPHALCMYYVVVSKFDAAPAARCQEIYTQKKWMMVLKVLRCCKFATKCKRVSSCGT